MSFTVSPIGLDGLTRQAVSDAIHVEEVGTGDHPSRQAIRLAGSQHDGHLAVAVAVAKHQPPGVRTQDVVPLGDDAVSLAEVPVVGPEPVRRALPAELEGVIGADGVDQVNVDRRLASVRERGGHQHVGPAILEDIGDLDVGGLLPGQGDQPQGDATPLDEHPVQLRHLVHPRGLDLDPGEFQVAELRARVIGRELVALAVAARQVDEAAADIADGHIRVAPRLGLATTATIWSLTIAKSP